MKFLVICPLREGADPQTEIVPHAGDEMTALRRLRDDGSLRDAYSPGGPGAILFFEGTRDEVERVIQELPLVRVGAITTELIELHAFAGLTFRRTEVAFEPEKRG